MAVTQSCHGSLLFLLIQHFELVLGEGLAWLRHHFNHIQDQNLNTSNQTRSDQQTFIDKKTTTSVAVLLCAAHPAPAGDLLPLHQAGPRCDVALQSGHRLLTPQCHCLHAGHMFPLLQVDPNGDRDGSE